jgi:hypothetical protein
MVGPPTVRSGEDPPSCTAMLLGPLPLTPCDGRLDVHRDPTSRIPTLFRPRPHGAGVSCVRDASVIEFAYGTAKRRHTICLALACGAGYFRSQS